MIGCKALNVLSNNYNHPFTALSTKLYNHTSDYFTTKTHMQLIENGQAVCNFSSVYDDWLA